MILLLLPLSGFAQTSTCDARFLFEPHTLPTASTWMNAWGLHLLVTPTFINMEGDAEILEKRLWLRAEKLYIDRIQKRLTAQDNVRIQTAHWLFKADELSYEQKRNIISTQTLTFQSTQKTYRGNADSLKEKGKKNVTLLQEAKLTTCPLGNDDWYLHARTLKLDRNTQRAFAHHAWLDFKGVPLFYTPYLSYPLNDRASGLLMPTFSQYQSPNRDDPSWIIGIPYYFNIAPNYDDTLTLYQMQDHGSLLDNEFRSLNTWQSSTLTSSWINDEATGNHRWRIKLMGKQTWRPTLTSDIDWQRVSDKDFYSDFPLDNNLKTASYAQRHMRINWQPSRNFNAYLLHQDYLLLRDASTYYEKRPEFGLNWQKLLTPAMSTQLNIQTTDFDIPTAGHTKPEGLRNVVTPALIGNWVKPWGNYGGSIRLQNNRYTLQNYTPDSSTFQVPMSEIHALLIFERPAKEWGIGWLQTLEPKVQFTYIPLVKDQFTTPNFDSGLRSLNFSNLFELNRFTGYDRIGDTKKLSFALTSRLLTSKGKERFRAAFGQAFFLEPRQLTLTKLKKNTQPRSNYFVQLQLNHPQVWWDNTAEIKTDTPNLLNLISRLKLNFHQFSWKSQYNWENISQPNVKQTLLGGLILHLPQGWQVSSFSNYDFIQQRRIENLHALSHESCCWKMELQVNERQTETRKYVYHISLSFTLKGLSTVGQTFTQQLDDKLNF